MAEGNREVWMAPAKINLWLAIGPRGRDGYHAIDTCFQTIDLADTVTLSSPTGREPVTCRVAGSAAEKVPEGLDNLAARAAMALGERTGHAVRVAIEIEKRIPQGAGLGGASSDAAAVLYALGKRYAVPAPERTLVDLAAELGADVPFFLRGGTARASGIGDRLVPVEPPSERWGVLVVPGTRVSTAWAYRAWDEAGEAGWIGDEDMRSGPGEGGSTLPADWRTRGNDFESVVPGRMPDVTRALEALGSTGGSIVRLAGSGSAAFALYPSRDRREAAFSRVRDDGSDAWVERIELIDHGVTRRRQLESSSRP